MRIIEELHRIKMLPPIEVGTCRQTRKANIPYKLKAAMECPLGKLNQFALTILCNVGTLVKAVDSNPWTNEMS
ncbi:hypothetical protein [Paenibacillus cremeus]|uniref:hypothetical protein n=1 Tax=Paenibacillus cremeus TaxID=2163881 RepID=UPI0021BD8660|nr:hypothetical protein [Paenibacillus cremeus]